MARGRDQRGSALVDFTLVSVLLLPIVLGLMQVALVLHVRTTLAAAASEGARLAATADRGLGEGVARTRAEIADAIGGSFAEDVSVRHILIDGAPAVEVTVSAAVPALGLGGPAVAFSVSGRAVEEMPR